MPDHDPNTPTFRALKPEDLPQGFDKKATLDDNDESMVKRGIVEDPNDTGSADDGFVLPSTRVEQ